MTAVLSEVLVAAAAALMCVCLCWAMSRGERDRACPVRPVPPRRPAGGTTWTDPSPVDPDAPWHDPETTPVDDPGWVDPDCGALEAPAVLGVAA